MSARQAPLHERRTGAPRPRCPHGRRRVARPRSPPLPAPRDVDHESYAVLGRRELRVAIDWQLIVFPGTHSRWTAPSRLRQRRASQRRTVEGTPLAADGVVRSRATAAGRRGLPIPSLRQGDRRSVVGTYTPPPFGAPPTLSPPPTTPPVFFTPSSARRTVACHRNGVSRDRRLFIGN